MHADTRHGRDWHSGNVDLVPVSLCPVLQQQCRELYTSLNPGYVYNNRVYTYRASVQYCRRRTYVYICMRLRGFWSIVVVTSRSEYSVRNAPRRGRPHALSTYERYSTRRAVEKGQAGPARVTIRSNGENIDLRTRYKRGYRSAERWKQE